MKRFLTLVGVAVVAAAMYVAASSASQQSKGPTAKQFNALKKQVTAQGKELKAVSALSVVVAQVLADCTNKGTLSVDVFGTPYTAGGYQFQNQNSSVTLTSAVNIVDPANDSNAISLMAGGANCTFDLRGLRHAAAKAGIRVPAFHPLTAHRR